MNPIKRYSATELVNDWELYNRIFDSSKYKITYRTGYDYIDVEELEIPNPPEPLPEVIHLSTQVETETTDKDSDRQQYEEMLRGIR